ncbi:Protein transport protein Sec24-like [Vitis vinifera]|uniref:Protein transport protein Sec24-like n=1 Tax=Vitis vinifera TaxID=29760 RepID=A0A438IS65_VITVI|nr:Protein transport protein Sec24-like [Vitis vinifera]
MQNLQINRPPSVPNSTPRPPPSYIQSPPSHSSAPYSAPQHSAPFPRGAPVSRPGPSPGPQSGRPSGYPISQALPFGSRPSTGSFPSPMGGQVTTSSGAPPSAFASSSAAPPSAFPASGFSAGPVIPPVAARPGVFASSPLSTGPIIPPSSAPGGPTSNGPPMFASAALQGTFPASNHANSPRSTAPNVPPGPPVQTAPTAMPFSAAPQGVPPPSGSPYGLQTWPMQPRQVAPPPTIPGSVQPPRMFGMPPPPPNQSMAAMPPAMSQTGAPLAGPSKIDPNQIPRPIPNTSVILHETRQGNQANPPPPATSDYIVRDTGNCSPRYMRCTINQIPCTADLLTTSGMQLALLVQPLALPHPSEEPIQVMN